MMSVILLRNLRSLNHSKTTRIFSALVGSMIVYAIFDLICGLSENDVLQLNQLTASIANLGFFYASFAVALFSFLYAQYELEMQWLSNRRLRYLSALPALLLTLITPLSLKWHFFFYIDAGGEYIKGPLYPLMLVLYYGYVLAVGIQAAILLPNKRYYARRSKLVALASFVVFPLAAGVLQAIYTGISIICLGGTIAMVQVFINIQDTRITMDPLTQLANREKLMQYLDARIGSGKYARGGLWLLMVDIDDFKQINDRYGHVEGDAALKFVADVLRTEFSGVGSSRATAGTSSASYSKTAAARRWRIIARACAQSSAIRAARARAAMRCTPARAWPN